MDATSMVRALQARRFLVLLSALVVGLVLEPLTLGVRHRGWVFDLFYSLIVIAAMMSLTLSRRKRRALVVLGAATILTTWIVYAFRGDTLTGSRVVSECTNVVFLTICVIGVVRAVIRRGTVTLDSVFGAMAGYLLLGLAWSNAYLILHAMSPQAFSYSEQLAKFVSNSGARPPVFTYYSFVTLSTLGYGDMTPVTHAARTLSWVEALSGQFYVAVLVAGIVSALVSAGLQNRGPGRADEKPGL